MGASSVSSTAPKGNGREPVGVPSPDAADLRVRYKLEVEAVSMISGVGILVLTFNNVAITTSSLSRRPSY